VTPAIRDYVEEKISRAVHNFATGLKHIDVTISARGGDTGTHGARCVLEAGGGEGQRRRQRFEGLRRRCSAGKIEQRGAAQRARRPDAPRPQYHTVHTHLGSRRWT
jgi:hypothetical protein